jgi:hypothetical protein
MAIRAQRLSERFPVELPRQDQQVMGGPTAVARAIPTWEVVDNSERSCPTPLLSWARVVGWHRNSTARTATPPEICSVEPTTWPYFLCHSRAIFSVN